MNELSCTTNLEIYENIQETFFEETKLEKYKKLSRRFSSFNFMPINGKKAIIKEWSRWSYEDRPFNEAEYDSGKNAGIVCGPRIGDSSSR